MLFGWPFSRSGTFHRHACWSVIFQIRYSTLASWTVIFRSCILRRPDSITAQCTQYSLRGRTARPKNKFQQNWAIHGWITSSVLNIWGRSQLVFHGQWISVTAQTHNAHTNQISAKSNSPRLIYGDLKIENVGPSAILDLIASGFSQFRGPIECFSMSNANAMWIYWWFN